MRKIVFILCLCFIANNSFAQSNGLLSYFKLTADDTKHERFDRIAVDFYQTSFRNVPEGIEQGRFSLGVSAYWYKDLPLGEKSRVSFAFGAGFSSYNIHHNGVFYEKDGYTHFDKLPDSVSWKKNKLATNYLDIPFEFRLRKMKGKNKFRFYPGFKAGFLVNDHTKWKTKDVKYKFFNLPNTLIYHYGATLRLVWNKIALYGYYSLTPLFDYGKGVEIYPIGIGVSWIRF